MTLAILFHLLCAQHVSDINYNKATQHITPNTPLHTVKLH